MSEFMKLDHEDPEPNDVLKRLPSLLPKSDGPSYLTKQSGVYKLNSSALVKPISKLTFRSITDPVAVRHQVKKERELTSGEKWFDMPKTEITPTIRRDLQLLKLRNVLDPKRHYKRENDKELPTYFQTGTVVEGPTEYYSRMTKKQRKQTLADEILADQKSKDYFKRRYDEIQAVKTSGNRNRHTKPKRRR
ncbi:Fcf2 pre-rRNA processing-domain-containing protein [Lipomyces arxii]|uniref:Fcf2 pre-rRNA processing-domain-containing protein n=1 Tax=Lipomyces arxii TaxID=56418 RepID=UPI0034CD56C3